jgi:hypothetical protein
VADIGTENWSNFFYWDLNGNPRCLVCGHIISWACRFCTPPTFIRMRDKIQCLETRITLAHPEINNIGSLSLSPLLFDNDLNSSSFSSPVHRLIVTRLQRSSQEQHNFLCQTLLKLYNGKCAITGCSFVSTLEACHIVPFAEGGSYNPSNSMNKKI